MSKLQEKIDQYTEEVNKLGLKLDTNLLASVTKGLGPSIYKVDAEKVSSSDTKELDTVKKNFLIKKLGLEDTPKLDEAIQKAIETIGSSNRNKYRAIFYTILVEEFGAQAVYAEDAKEEVEAPKEEKKEEVAAEAPKQEEKAAVVEEVKEEAPKKEEKEVVAKTEEVKAEAPAPEPTNTQEFLDNFNWHKYEEGIEAVDESKLEEFDKALKGTVGFVEERQVIDGEVIRLTDREAIIDINSKSEGVISLNEFRYNPNLAVGDTVEVLVDKREDSTGQLVLSHKKARVIKAWERVNTAHETQEVVNGYIKCRTKGGMIVDVFGIEAFLPGSQIDVKPIRDYDQYVDKTMEFKVVKVNHEFKNVVVSHKALIEADLAEQKKEIIGQLEKGQVLEGIVKNITSYGVFVDLGGVDGLVHITDLSWSRINHPSEVLELDEKINVVILDFDDNKSRIQLGLKQLQKHPWEALDNELKVGDKVKGKVAIIADYGAFIEVSQGVEGLIHVSEMSWSTHLRSAQDFVKVGDEVEAVILTLDREERKMSLGMKQLHPDPWTDVTTKYPVGSKHTGTVRNYTNFGVFVELEEGIDGLVYISDLSWTTKVKHPSDFVKVGDKLEVEVLELDVEGRKLNLGHKQTTENPWDAYEDKFSIDSVHAGEVTSVTDKGALVSFGDDDVEAFVPQRHMEKEDGSKIVKGDKVDFKVLEFNKEYRRLVVSHTANFREQEEKTVRATKKKMDDNIEKSTLGDISALAALKDKMDADKK
ncbi:30S ribosomal protein S1 [Aureibaculum sp. A20]|uniref:30S ribosomal protein S1 n=1 Tax=Aureibaculum flavum TaxID=2795986 RepID=A0ABS0WLQ2_9FLAO|nr:30S ribosomal protein S1 [Aureibaculum flavum]MBJ2172879.1 30S ribosomal protein S1 [Aureibaculum flavum]